MRVTIRPEAPAGDAGAPPSGDARSPARARPALRVLCPVAALPVALLLHAAGLDVLTAVLGWLLIALVLRSGRTVLDRLVLAAIVLAGALLSGELAFSAIGWGVSALPVGATLLAATAAAAALRYPRLSLPRRVEFSDLAVVGPALFAFWYAARPLRGLDAVTRLPFETVINDRMAHFALFDAIGHTHGYTFIHQVAGRQFVQSPFEVAYPQGSHMLLALVSSFAPGGQHLGTVDLLDRYFTLVLIVFAGCVGAAAWAARWIAGPASGPLMRCAVAGAAATFVLLGPVPATLVGGDSQLFGLAVLALAAALVVRPLPQYREHVLAAAALVIAAFYAYNPFGPFVAVGFVGSAIAYRLPVRAQWRFTAAVGIPAGLIAVYPSFLSATDPAFDARAQALVGGGHLPMSNWLVPLVAALAVLPFASGRARRSGIGRGVVALLGTLAVVLGLFWLYATTNRGGAYYGAKLLSGAYVMLVCLLGTAGLLAARPERTTSPARSRGWPARAGAAVAAVITALALLACSYVQHRLPGTTDGRHEADYVWLRRWSAGQVQSGGGKLEVFLARAGAVPSGTPTIVVPGATRSGTWGASFYASSLNEDLGAMKDALNVLSNARLTAAERRLGTGRYADFTAVIRLAAARCPHPPRILVYSAALAADLTASLARAPAVPASVTYLRGIAAAQR